MGPFEFGMTKEQILKILAKQIKEAYAEKVKATTDVYMQDKLRRKQKAEIKRIKRTHIAFTGKKSGWDVSIIDDQFARNTGESMMVYWENAAESGKDQRRFFFFHEGRLYKMFIQLGSAMLKDDQRSFSYFHQVMQRRYGGGKVTMKKGSDEPTSVLWSSRKFNVTALDKLEFYNSFCLVIADPGAEAALAAAREAMKRDPTKSNIIDSVVLGKDEDDTPSLDQNKGVVDRMTK
jgi:hypothetical protein